MSDKSVNLIPNIDKVQLIQSNICPNCLLTRRTNFELLTPGDELDPELWQAKEIFGMSVNIFLCNIQDLDLSSHISDVNIIPNGEYLKDYTKFITDEQISEYDFNKMEFTELKTNIIYFKHSEIQSLEGSYPMNDGTPKRVEYKYKLLVEYDPLTLNCFHTLINVLTDEFGDWKVVDKETAKKKYIKTLATKIRAQILVKKLVYIFI